MVRLGEARFEGLLEAMAAAVVVVDAAGVIRFVSRRTEVLFGYDGADLVGQPVETLVPESLRHVHRAHRAGFLVHPETRFMGAGLQLFGRRRDGSLFPADITLCSAATEDGPLVIAAVYDMTDLHKPLGDVTGRNQAVPDLTDDTMAATAAAEKLSGLSSQQNDAIIGKTLDGIITSWNPAAERMYGYTSQEIVGRPVWLLSPVGRTEEFRGILIAIKAGESVPHFTTLRVRKDGGVFRVSLSVSPIRDSDDAIVGACTIAHELTGQTWALVSARP